MLFPEGFSRDEILGFMGVSDVERIAEKRIARFERVVYRE